MVSQKINNEKVEIYKHVNGLSSGKFLIFFGNRNIWWQWKLVGGNRYLYGLWTQKHFHAVVLPTKLPQQNLHSQTVFLEKDFGIKHYIFYAFIVGFSHSRLLSKWSFFLEEVEVSLRKDLFSLGIGFLQSSCPWTKKKSSVRIKRSWILLTKNSV